ncbi:MAG: hypothetical protein QW802_00545 [Candidatus Altiarchaeota archaeon]
MLKKIFRISIEFMVLLALLYLSQLTLAFNIECYECTTENCRCKTNCQNGFVNIYLTKCQGMPIYELSVTGGLINWQPKAQGTYYWKILCDNGEKSGCEELLLHPTNKETKIESQKDEFVITLAILSIIIIFVLLVYNSTKSLFNKKREKYRIRK